MSNLIRKSWLVTFLPLFFLGASFVHARPYLKIHEVKSQEYPYIGAEISISEMSPLDDLNESNFSLYENGWKVGFFRIKKTDPQKSPKKIILLIDSSKSLSPAAFKAQVDAAQMLINGLYPADEVSVISFNDTAQTHCGFTNSHQQLKQCLGEIRQSGKKTVLYDALYKALTLNASVSTDRSFIILFTDGKEEKSVFSLKDINDQVQKVSIPVFIVCAGKSNKLIHLARISHLTGGEIYNAPDMDSIVKIYRLLSSLMDGTYQIQYLSQAMKTTGADQKNLPSGAVRLEIRMEHGTVHDQDIIEFYLPTASFWTSLENAYSDERFKIFLGSSFILILIVIFISHFARFNLKGSIKKDMNKKREATSPVLENSLRSVKGDQSESVRKVSGDRFVSTRNGKIVEESPLQLLDNYFAYVIEKEGPHTGRTSKIKWNIVTIGHGNENTIVIDDPTVSYNHAKIVMTDNEFYLYDMISESGVYLNGKKLLRPKQLNDFDEISIGRTKLLFRKVSK